MKNLIGFIVIIHAVWSLIKYRKHMELTSQPYEIPFDVSSLKPINLEDICTNCLWSDA